MATTIVTKKGSGAPAASDLVEGELAVDTTNGRLYTENSSAAVVELGSNPSGNITFGDNGKAIFGAGSDLQIYHDGDSSYISHNTTGTDFVVEATSPGDDLILRAADDLNFRVNGNENGIVVVGGGATTLYNSNAAKLATTATGINVTGGVTADGLTVETSADPALITLRHTGNTSGLIIKNFSGGEAQLVNADNAPMVFKTNNIERLRIDASGKLLIGDSGSHTSDLLQIETPASGGGHGIQIRRNDSNTDQVVGSITFGNNTATDLASISTKTDGATDNGALLFNTSVSGGANTERMRIDASGNIQQATSKNGDLYHHISNANTGTSAEATIYISNGATSSGLFAGATGTAFTTTGGFVQDGAHIGAGAAAVGGLSIMTRANAPIRFYTNGHTNERMRVDSSGNLLVGGTSAYAQGATTLASGGVLYVSRNGGSPATFRRNSDDGGIVTLEKDGTTVGSIGNNVNNLTINGLNAVELRQGGTTRAYVYSNGLHPWNDATYSLGIVGSRWSDIYLSGGAYLGGTAAANKLDGYEEGTWDPEIYYQNATDQAAATDVVQSGTYTKVGNIVNVSFRLEWTAGTGLSTDNIGVKNLPFVGASNHYNSVGTFFGTYTGSDSPSLGNISAGGSLALVLDVANSGNLAPSFGTGSGRYIRGSMTYLAA